jgi:hypothetical protein
LIRALTLSLLLTIAAVSDRALAQANEHSAQANDPLELANAILNWFSTFDQRWSAVVEREQVLQLVRQTDSLRMALYPVIRDTSTLLEVIPDRMPDGAEAQMLRQQIRTVDIDLANLRRVSQAVGPGIGITNQEAQSLVDRSILSRSLTLTYLKAVLEKSLARKGAWDPAELRRRLSVSLDRLSKAQLALTTSRENLKNRLR